MKSQIFVLQAVLMLSSLFVLLPGCTSETVSTTDQTGTQIELESVATKAEVTQLITRTPMNPISPASTSTPYATTSPTSAPTKTSISVMVSTSVSTQTLIPTLSPQQAEGVIHGLFEDNGGCLLPCFWGITPGETEWQAAQQFLLPLAFQIYADDISAEVRLPDPTNSNATELRQAYAYEDGIITWIISPVVQTLNFQPSSILQVYGPPSEVWLGTANASREGHWRSILTLFYPEQGFILQYGGNNTQQDDKVRACEFEQTDLILLGAWLSKEELSYQAVASRSVRFGETTFDQPVEEATGMDVETFYETFKDPNNPICLETPLSLWPAP